MENIANVIFCADIARLFQYFNNISDRFRNILAILQYFEAIFRCCVGNMNDWWHATATYLHNNLIIIVWYQQRILWSNIQVTDPDRWAWPKCTKNIVRRIFAKKVGAVSDRTSNNRSRLVADTWYIWRTLAIYMSNVCTYNV